MLTETSSRVLGLDPLPPVLAEEHVRAERALGRLRVLLPGALGLFGLLSGGATL